jgi:glyoxylase-like metal-dependent hydrolase (beta-lactamase superfamily II)
MSDVEHRTMIRSALAAFGFLTISACANPAPRAVAPTVELYVMDCGRIHVSDADSFADDGSFAGQARDLIVPCYLIRHAKGYLVWDAGLPDAIHDRVGGVDSGVNHVEVPVKLVEQLARLNLTPADIQFLSFSHSHFDHVGNAALFAHATWIVDADERTWMFREEARKDEDFAQVAALEGFRTTQVVGAGDHDVFGDGSVTIVQTPGHTPGHCVLLVRLARAGAVLLTGDMWHLAESRKRRTVPRFNTDRAQTLSSMDKVEALAKSTGARVVRQHVLEDFAALPKFPAALN